MGNLIESMIHENVQFSESKKVKKLDKKKVVKESKETVRNSVDFRRNRILYTLADKAVKGSSKYQDVVDYIIDRYGFDINTLESFGDLRMKLNELGLIEVTELYNYLIETGLIEPKKESKKKKVKESVDGKDEVCIIIKGGMVQEVFSTRDDIDASVIDLDVEYDSDLYDDVIHRLNRIY